MENIINTFYKGNINKFGFGGWNTTKNNIPEILGAYPYPSNTNRQIDRYFQKSNVNKEGNSLHKNYVPNLISQTLPSEQRVDFSKSNAMDLKPISISQYKNFDNHGFMNTQVKPVPQTNFSPALIRMEYLENKVRDLENKNRAEMVKSLNDINNKYIDPRFKQFLDNNQGKYDVFGNDPDPLDQRRLFVQNNLGDMRNKLDVEERKERKKKRKKEKKLKKKKKKKNKFFDISESGEEEKENEERNTLLADQNINEENNLTKLNSAQNIGSQNISPSMTRRASINANQQGILKKTLRSTLHKNTTKSPTKNATKRNSIKSKAGKGKSVYSTIEAKESKEVKPTKEVKVCGDVGYSFTAQNRTEKELQFQTNRLGKDFDKLLNEIRDFKRVIKDKINLQNNDEMNKLNIYKDIFLLDNKAKMKYAVDKIINRTNETFDPVAYQKKVDNEKQVEINDIINKKIDEYNIYRDKVMYNKKINSEKKQMINDNLINKFEYQKYREKLNSQITSLPNIFIRGANNITKNRQEKKNTENGSDKNKNESNKKSKVNESKLSKKSEKKKNVYVREISEETILDFGSFINGNDQFRTKQKREISRRSETFIDPSEIKKDVKISTIKEGSKSMKSNKNDEGKEQLIKAIKEKEEKEQKSKTTKKKTIKEEEVEDKDKDKEKKVEDNKEVEVVEEKKDEKEVEKKKEKKEKKKEKEKKVKKKKQKKKEKKRKKKKKEEEEEEEKEEEEEEEEEKEEEEEEKEEEEEEEESKEEEKEKKEEEEEEENEEEEEKENEDEEKEEEEDENDKKKGKKKSNKSKSEKKEKEDNSDEDDKDDESDGDDDESADEEDGEGDEES